MAIIYSYPQIGELATSDTIAISDASNGNKTKSVTVGQLDSYINTGQATIIQVDDRVVTGASFNTGSGLLTLTRNSGDILPVTTNLDGRYYLSSNPSNYTSNLGVVQSLTTNNSSGAATLVNGTLNIPQYPGGSETDNYVDGGSISGNTLTLTRTGGLSNVNIPGLLELGVTSLTALAGDTDIGQVQTLTTTGTSGAATLIGGVLNIPQYSSGGGSGITEITTTAPITGGPITTTGTIGITQASTSTNGYLSSTDWTAFNNKQSTSEKGAASGYAPLDSNSKIPSANLPDSIVGAVVYKGTWDANNNIPTLPSPGSSNNGHYYIVSDAGTYLGIVYAVGDWAISNGIDWEKVDNTQDVNSVFGRQGNIVADANDYSNFYDANVQSNWSETNSSNDAFILNKPTTITQAQANEIAANTLKTSFPGFGLTAGTALEGNTNLLQIGTTAGTALEGDTPVVEGTTTSQTVITEIKTLTSTEYASETKLNNVMYVIV